MEDAEFAVTINGKGVDVGEALQTHITASLEARVRKYFRRAVASFVTLSKDGYGFRVEIKIQVGSLIVMGQSAVLNDPYLAYGEAEEHVTKQLRRNKRKLQGHRDHKGDKGMAVAIPGAVARRNPDSR